MGCKDKRKYQRNCAFGNKKTKMGNMKSKALSIFRENG